MASEDGCSLVTDIEDMCQGQRETGKKRECEDQEYKYEREGSYLPASERLAAF